MNPRLIGFVIVTLLTISSITFYSQASDGPDEPDFILEHSIPSIRDLEGFIVSPDDTVLYVYASDKVTLYDLETYEILHEKSFNDRYFKDGYWSGDQLIFASYPKNQQHPLPGSISIISPADLSLLNEYDPVKDSFIALEPSYGGQYLAGISGRDLWIMNISDDFKVAYHFYDPSERIRSIAWNPNEEILASAGYNIHIHDVETKSSRSLSVREANSNGLFWSANGSLIYNLDYSGSLETVDVTTGETIGTKGIANGIRCGDINPNRTAICLGSGWETKIVMLETMAIPVTLNEATNAINSVLWTEDGYRVISGANDGVLRVYIDRNHVNYNPPPVITILRPGKADKVNSSFTANGMIFDEDPLLYAIFKLNDGTWQSLASPDNWSMEIDENDLLTGINKLWMKASDGHKETVEVVSFTYDPGTEMNLPPTVRIGSPDDGSEAGDLVSVAGVASDNIEVMTVTIRLDRGPWIRANGSEAWDLILDLTDVDEGWHLIEARAYDGSLFSNYDSINVYRNRTMPVGNERPVLIVDNPVEEAEGIVGLDCSGSVVDDSPEVSTYISIDGGKWDLISEKAEWDVQISLMDLPDGWHEMAFRASDGWLFSETVVVRIIRLPYYGPQVTITSPSQGEGFIDSLVITGTVKGGYGNIVGVEVRIGGGEWRSADGKREWTYTYEPSGQVLGEILFEVKAWEAFSTSEIASVTAIRYNPMVVTIESPTDGQYFNSPLNVTGTVEGGFGDIELVGIRVNGGEWMEANGTASWSVVIGVGDLAHGNVVIEARAMDDMDWSEISIVTVEYREDTGPTNSGPSNLLIMLILGIAIVLGVLFYLYRWKRSDGS